jgi:hypothetical protein
VATVHAAITVSGVQLIFRGKVRRSHGIIEHHEGGKVMKNKETTDYVEKAIEKGMRELQEKRGGDYRAMGCETGGERCASRRKYPLMSFYG